MKIDIEKVKLAKTGDKNAFAELYDSVSTDLYRMALHNLGNSFDAEDVVSETFIEAYKGIKNLREESSFKPWIMRILYIRCKRKVGDYIKDRATDDIEEHLDISDTASSVEQSTSVKVTVQTAMEKLGEDERSIIILSVLNGYTTKEIGEILSMPHGTVSSKLHRAYSKLRVIIGERP